MAGRRPLPTAIKECKGNPGGRPLNKLEPKPTLGVPERPKGMNRAANREWEIICDALMEMKVLSIVDGKALGEYCKLMGLAEVYYKEVLKKPMFFEPIFDAEGMAVKDADGNVLVKPKPNPSVNTYAMLSKAAKSYLTEFGLTPSSRSRLKVEKASAEDPKDKMLTREAGASQEPREEISLDDIDENAAVM